jgi:hypothetical protein
MTTSQILEATRDALAADTALTDWCVAQFGTAPTILLGLDDKNPPAEDEYPLVALIGVDQERGNARREVDWRLHLGAGVVNSAIVETGSTQTCTGMLQAETLREMAENALYRAGLVDLSTTGESSSESYHPLYVSYSMVTVSQLKSTMRALP